LNIMDASKQMIELDGKGIWRQAISQFTKQSTIRVFKMKKEFSDNPQYWIFAYADLPNCMNIEDILATNWEVMM
jgi:hypothetical protein